MFQLADNGSEGGTAALARLVVKNDDIVNTMLDDDKKFTIFYGIHPFATVFFITGLTSLETLIQPDSWWLCKNFALLVSNLAVSHGFANLILRH